MSFKRGRTREVLPFGLEYKDILTSTPTVDKPQLPLPVNGDLSNRERYEAETKIQFARILSESAFHSGSVMDFVTVSVDDGIQRYSDRYNKAKNGSDTKKDLFVEKELFPEELHGVIGKGDKKRKVITSNSKLMQTSKAHKADKTPDDEETTKAALERLREMEVELDVEGDQGNKKDEEDNEEPEEEEDDEFEEDDDDDYNAEKYFDDDDEGGDDDGEDEAAF